ncbi:MAG: PLDc N-terminal domain-containing protein [Actinomycetota bacterium]
MIFGEGFLGIALLFLWIFCIFDVISSEPELVRNLPKLVWLLVVIVVPDVGSIAWLALGRPRGAAIGGGVWQRAPRASRPSPGPVGPEDSPHFLRDIEQRRLKAWEDDLRRREEELRRRDDGES